MSSTTALIVPNATAETVALPHGGAFHLLAEAGDTAGALSVNRLPSVWARTAPHRTVIPGPRSCSTSSTAPWSSTSTVDPRP